MLGGRAVRHPSGKLVDILTGSLIRARLPAAAVAVVALVGACSSAAGTSTTGPPPTTAAPPTTAPPATTTTMPPATTTTLAPPTTAEAEGVEIADDGAYVVHIRNGSLHPSVLNVDPESAALVRWHNDDEVPYVLTSRTRDENGDRLFESDEIEPGGTYEIDFSQWEPAAFSYFTMRGNSRIPGLVDTSPSRPPVAFEFEPDDADVSPPGVLDSFAATSMMEVGLGDGAAFVFETEGVAVGDDLSCTVTVRFGGLEFTEHVVVSAGTTWIDSGNGYESVLRSSSAAAGTLELCPVTEEFWLQFGEEPPPIADPVPETLGDLETLRYELADLVDVFDLAALGFGDDWVIRSSTVWLADPGGWIAGIEFDMSFPAAVMTDLVGEMPLADPDGIVDFSLETRVSRPNDPTLEVTPVTPPADA